jgi:ribonuclease P protein component
MKANLRGSQDFQRVYRDGNRYHTASFTAFVLLNDLSHHRLGITASRKALGNAVQRNRGKRVLREAFRLSEPLLTVLEHRYDWVLNAKGKLLDLNTRQVMIDLRSIVKSVRAREAEDDRLQLT